MPTEDMKQEMGETFVMTEDGKRKEIKDVTVLKTINDFKEDIQKEFKKHLNKETNELVLDVKFTKEADRRIAKMFGSQKITRKRFIKLLMGCKMQRNVAVDFANMIHEVLGFYTPMVVQSIFEAIMEMWILSFADKVEE